MINLSQEDGTKIKFSAVPSIWLLYYLACMLPQKEKNNCQIEISKLGKVNHTN